MMLEILLSACATFSVYDGDQIKCNGVTYRLVGVNAPEVRAQPFTKQKLCEPERIAGLRARDRLRQLARDPSAKLQEVLCYGSNFGRKCGVVTVREQNVAVTLVRENLGDEYYCGSKGCPKRRNWCAAS